MAALTAEEYPIVTNFFNFLHSSIEGYVTDTSASIVAAITPVASVCGIIVIMVYGILLMRGSVEAPLMDAIYRGLKLIVILGFALNVGIYQTYIADFFLNAPSHMAAVISGIPTDTDIGQENAAPITEFLVASFNLADRLWAEADTFDFGNYIMGGIVYVLGTILGAYAAFLFALSSIAVAVLLAVGPIFILLSVFESGKKFLEMWLQQAFNFGFVAVLTAACLRFFLSNVEFIASKAIEKESPIETFDVTTFSVISLIGVLVLRQVMPIASGLAGGMALATQGAFGAAAGAMGRALGATAKRYTPNNVAERYRRNQRNSATWRKIRGEWGDRAASVKGAAQKATSAASNAYKRKFEPNRVSKAA